MLTSYARLLANVVALVCPNSLVCKNKKNVTVDQLVSRVPFHAVISKMIAPGCCKDYEETTFTKSAPHLGFFVCHSCCCVRPRLVCCVCANWRATLRRLQCAEHTAAHCATSTLCCTRHVINTMHAPTHILHLIISVVKLQVDTQISNGGVTLR